MPLFNKIGYQNVGYSKNSNASLAGDPDYVPGEEYTISTDINLYPRVSNRRAYSSTKDTDIVYNTTVIDTINSSFLEVEKDCPQTTINQFVGFLKEINEKASFLFTKSKISLLSKTSFHKAWPYLGNSIVGISYSGDKNGVSHVSRSIDIIYDYYTAGAIENYHILVHEMSHNWDYYYSYKTNNKANSTKGRISSQEDVLNLYYKYRRSSSRPFRNYAYTNETEFFAEMMTYYYLKYYAPYDKYSKLTYPDDAKKVVEKYICIAKNNYDEAKCN